MFRKLINPGGLNTGLPIDLAHSTRPSYPVWIVVTTIGKYEYSNPPTPVRWTPIRTTGTWEYTNVLAWTDIPLTGTYEYKDPQTPLIWTPIRTTGNWNYKDPTVWTGIPIVGAYDYEDPTVPTVWTPIRATGTYEYKDPQTPLTWTPIRTTGNWIYKDPTVWTDIPLAGTYEYKDPFKWTEINITGQDWIYDSKNQPWVPLPTKDRYFINGSFVNQVKINSIYKNNVTGEIKAYCTAVRDINVTSQTWYIGNGSGGYQDEQLIPNGTTEVWSSSDLAAPKLFNCVFTGKNGYVNVTNVNALVELGDIFHIGPPVP